MLKYLFLFFLLMPVLSSGVRAGEKKLSSTCHFPPPQLKAAGDFLQVKMAGRENFHRAGEPLLPFQSLRLLIPAGFSAVSVQALPGEEIELPGSYRVAPAQAPVSLSFQGIPRRTAPDPAFYNSSRPFPPEIISRESLQWKKGFSILLLNLFPVRYRPAAGRISYFPRITVKVILHPDPSLHRRQEKAVYLPTDREEVRRLVENPEEINSYPPPRKAAAQYQEVIITPSSLKEAFAPLLSHRLSHWTTATVVTTEWIYTQSTGSDDQEKIRNFIRDAYQNWGVQFILLGGDADGVPPRLFYVEGIDNGALKSDWTVLTTYLPADLYYSNLDGPFNSNGNDKWGEPDDGEGGGDIDLFSEVAVGRWPVRSSQEVYYLINKTIAYEDAATGYVNRVSMVGEYLGFGGVSDFAKPSLEELRLGSDNYYYETVGFSANSWFDTLGTLYDQDYNPVRWVADPDLFDLLNAGVALVNHLGHGGTYSAWKMNVSKLSELKNDLPFFGYTQACLCGGFDNPDCWAEVMITGEYGAFGLVANARYGFGARESTDGPSQRYAREFWDALLGEDIRYLGKINADSKEDLAGRINEDNMRWCYYETNLFGDPATRIRIVIPPSPTPTPEGFHSPSPSPSPSVTALPPPSASPTASPSSSPTPSPSAYPSTTPTPFGFRTPSPSPSPSPGPTISDTFFVDGTGAPADDSFNGRYSLWQGQSDGPWKTIQHGVDQISPDETCWVRYTTYREMVVIAAGGTPGHPKTLRGDCDGSYWVDSGARPVIDAEGIRTHCLKLDYAKGRYWSIENLELTGSPEAGSNLFNYQNCEVRLTNCLIRDAAGKGIYNYHNGADLFLTDCVIRDNQTGIYDYNYGKIHLNRCDVRDNGYGIYGFWAGGQGEVTASLIRGNVVGMETKWNSLTVANCTIADNSLRGVYWNADSDAYHFVIDNSIIAGGRYGIWTRPAAAGDYNDVWDNLYNWGGDAFPGAHSFSRNPIFSDRPAGDYDIRVNSPCNQAGSIAWAPATDIHGDPFLDPPAIGCDENPSPRPTTPTPTPTPSFSPLSPIPTASATPTPSPTSFLASTPSPTSSPPPSPSPPPTPLHLILESGDYDGDGTVEVALFRPDTGLWSIRELSRIYWGGEESIPVSGDYDGDGTAEVAVFSPGPGLWALRGLSRFYWGSAGRPVPGDYDGDGSAETALFEEASGRWDIRGLTRFYFGRVGDLPAPGDHNGNGRSDIAVFRTGSGLWAVREISRFYFGARGDTAVGGEYSGNGTVDIGIFRPGGGLWALRGLTRVYFGVGTDRVVPADYDGNGADDIGIFRDSSGLWAIREISRCYYGRPGDLPVTR